MPNGGMLAGLIHTSFTLAIVIREFLIGVWVNVWQNARRCRPVAAVEAADKTEGER